MTKWFELFVSTYSQAWVKSLPFLPSWVPDLHAFQDVGGWFNFYAMKQNKIQKSGAIRLLAYSIMQISALVFGRPSIAGASFQRKQNCRSRKNRSLSSSTFHGFLLDLPVTMTSTSPFVNSEFSFSKFVLPCRVFPGQFWCILFNFSLALVDWDKEDNIGNALTCLSQSPHGVYCLCPVSDEKWQ